MTDVPNFYFGFIFDIFKEMNNINKLTYNPSIFIIPLFTIVFLWFIYWLEIKFGWNFNKFGIFPRSLRGLKGILFSPFIHSDTKHLFNNSVPLFVLMSSLFYFYKEIAIKVLVYGGILSSFLTWLIAREAYHIGASGIVYLLFGFVFFSGIIRKHYRLVALSFIIIFLYGSMVWYVLPIKEGISWEGHLSGLIFGLILALFYRKKGIVKEKYQFSKTDFDDMFDDQGNYIPPSLPLEENDLLELNYKYIYKEEE